MAQVYTAYPPPRNMAEEDEGETPVHTFNSIQSILYICIGVAAFVALIIGSIYGYLKWKKRRAPLDYSWRKKMPPSRGRQPPTENFLNTLARVDIHFGRARAAQQEADRAAAAAAADPTESDTLAASISVPAITRTKPLPALPSPRNQSLPALPTSPSITALTARPRPVTPIRQSAPSNLQNVPSSFRE